MFAPVINRALVSAPGAIAAGVGREMTNASVQSAADKEKPVSNRLWWMGAIAVGLGLAGKAAAHVTRNETWDDASAGLYHGGLAYVSQDATRTIRQKLKASNGSAAYTSAQRAQVARAQATRTQATAVHRAAAASGGEYLV